jgi:hypothetical protein
VLRIRDSVFVADLLTVAIAELDLSDGLMPTAQQTHRRSVEAMTSWQLLLRARCRRDARG